MATFVTVQPIEGEAGVTAVTVTAPENTGRRQRTDTVTFTTSSNKSATVIVNQSGKAVFFSISGYDQSVINKPNINPSGGAGYIEITTNSRAFCLGYYSDGLVPTITGATITSPTAGAADIVDRGPSTSYDRFYTWKTIIPTGDPGVDGQYIIRVSMTLPANNTQSNKELGLRICDADDYSIRLSESFTQSAVITVSQSTLSPSAEGDSAQVTVTSQEHWDASVDD